MKFRTRCAGQYLEENGKHACLFLPVVVCYLGNFGNSMCLIERGWDGIGEEPHALDIEF